MNLKKKKLYLIILTFVFVTIVTYTFIITRTEAPIIPAEATTLQKTPEVVKADIVKIDNEEKYAIVNRSIVSPVNILNKKKVILLTIDDGPGKRTIDMINILNAHNAKAIFFINGTHDSANEGVISETANKGFAVGNHTWSHINLKKEKNLAIIEKEINKNSDLITRLTGAAPKFFRPPYGESNTYVRKYVKDQGMILMDWSGAAMDWEKSSMEKDIFVSNVMKTVHSGSIILIHEHPWSVANLDSLLTSLEKDGYTYVDPKNIVE